MNTTNLLTRRELADALGVSYSTLRKRTDLPVIKMGSRTFRYVLEDVLTYLKGSAA